MKAELYWVKGPWQGRLAIAGRPRGGDWLADEAKAWAAAGVNTMVSFLTRDEVRDLGLEKEAGISEANGLIFLSFPIADRSVPSDRTATLYFVQNLERDLIQGRNVALHCRQSVGRSGLMAACLLVLSGLEPEAAFARLSEARGCTVPETIEQKTWVSQFAQEVALARS